MIDAKSSNLHESCTSALRIPLLWSDLTPCACTDSRIKMARDSRKGKEQETGLYEAIQRFWQKTYAGDYLGLILLLAAYLVLQFLGEPFHRMFRLDDPRIQFPHAEVERVSVCEFDSA